MYSLPPTQGQKIIILYWSGQNFKIITSAKHKGYISVWPECVAQGFQTLFVMREERFVIKTSGINPSRCFTLMIRKIINLIPRIYPARFL